MYARHQFIFQAHCPPICFGSAKPILLTKTYFMIANFSGQTDTITLKRDTWARNLYRNVFFKQIISIKLKQILGVKMFPGDSEEERPRGLGRIWGVKACQGVEKDDGGVTSRFNCLHKTAHTLLTNGNISKRRCFCPFSFRFLCFPLQSCSYTALIYDSTST